MILTSGCAGSVLGGGSRTAKLPLPACPPEQVQLKYGWSRPQTYPLPSGEALIVYMLESQDRESYLRWVDGWVQCARAARIVIEEANR